MRVIRSVPSSLMDQGCYTESLLTSLFLFGSLEHQRLLRNRSGLPTADGGHCAVRLHRCNPPTMETQMHGRMVGAHLTESSHLPISLMLLAAVTASGCVTIPAEPDLASMPSQVLEQPSASWRDAVEEGRFVARSLVAEEKLPGLSLAVAVNGEIVWAEGFRWADLEDRKPMTPAKLFRIGGVSESLTAAAVGLLSERGLLDLDAPVQRYVPGFPEKEWPVTTRQLMAHSAGIRRHHGEEEIFRKAGCANDAERLEVFASDPVRFRPGTEL